MSVDFDPSRILLLQVSYRGCSEFLPSGGASGPRNLFLKKRKQCRHPTFHGFLFCNQLCERSLKQEEGEMHLACRKYIPCCLIGDHTHAEALGSVAFNSRDS